MNPEDCRVNYRFEKEDIPRLAVLLGLLEFINTPNRLTISRHEAMCILLRRLAYPARLSDVSIVFGRHPADIRTIFNRTLSFIFEQHGQRLRTFIHPWLNLPALAQTVADKGAPLHNCFGFINVTVRPIERPSLNQRELYSGHKRVHGRSFKLSPCQMALLDTYLVHCQEGGMTQHC